MWLLGRDDPKAKSWDPAPEVQGGEFQRHLPETAPALKRGQCSPVTANASTKHGLRKPRIAVV